MSSAPASRARILFVYDRALSTFMARDWALISKTWPLSTLFRWRGWRDFPRLGHEAARSQLVFSWFGAAHALAAAVATCGRTPHVVVAGGWDVARLPDIDYGAHTSWWRHELSRFLFGQATRVLAVSEFTRAEAVRHAGVSPERLITVHHGFDPDAWPETTGARPLDVVTVSGTHALVKGIDLLIDTALRMPDVSFEVVGPTPGRELQAHMQSLPANLKFVGSLSGEAYRAKLQSARVLFQPSRQESFGCALAEAMLCGCIPVVSKRGALPEVLGDTGRQVDFMLPQEFERALRWALSADSTERTRVRERIVSRFHMRDYAERLYAALREAM